MCTGRCCSTGVSREVDNLIQENNELLATKYATHSSSSAVDLRAEPFWRI